MSVRQYFYVHASLQHMTYQTSLGTNPLTGTRPCPSHVPPAPRTIVHSSQMFTGRAFWSMWQRITFVVNTRSAFGSHALLWHGHHLVTRNSGGLRLLMPLRSRGEK